MAYLICKKKKRERKLYREFSLAHESSSSNQVTSRHMRNGRGATSHIVCICNVAGPLMQREPLCQDMLKRDTYALPCDGHTVCKGGCPPSGSPRYQVHSQTKFSEQRRFITPKEEQVGVGWGELGWVGSEQSEASKQATSSRQGVLVCRSGVLRRKRGSLC